MRTFPPKKSFPKLSSSPHLDVLVLQAVGGDCEEGLLVGAQPQAQQPEHSARDLQLRYALHVIGWASLIASSY